MKLIISGCKVCNSYRADSPYTTGSYALALGELIQEIPNKCPVDNTHAYLFKVVESPDLRYTLVVDPNPPISQFKGRVGSLFA